MRGRILIYTPRKRVSGTLSDLAKVIKVLKPWV